MSRTLSRVAGGALAILTAAAIGNVAVARAQTSLTTGTGGVAAISTDCGGGTLEQCSTEKTFKCEWTVKFILNPVTRTVEFSFSENCVESGSRPIYKDKYPSLNNSGSLGCTGSRDDDTEICG